MTAYRRHINVAPRQQYPYISASWLHALERIYIYILRDITLLFMGCSASGQNSVVLQEAVLHPLISPHTSSVKLHRYQKKKKDVLYKSGQLRLYYIISCCHGSNTAPAPHRARPDLASANWHSDILRRTHTHVAISSI